MRSICKSKHPYQCQKQEHFSHTTNLHFNIEFSVYPSYEFAKTIHLKHSMTREFTIRIIAPKDYEAVLEIYAPYITDSIISFEYEVPTLEEFTSRINAIKQTHPFLVAEHYHKIVGYAYSSIHRQRTAYQWSAECTVYLEEAFHRKGIAQKLYTVLFDIMRLLGYYTVYAGIGIPNQKSIAFHQAMGFTEVGIYKNSGYKLGQWRDTQWFQLQLQALQNEPKKPSKPNAPQIQLAINKIIDKANIG